MTRLLGKTLLVTTFILMSCDLATIKPKRAIHIKPFYVFDVGSHGAGAGHHWYKAIDRNGYRFEFVDTEGKYSIGDSIK
jgi:hypothetical protein